VGRTGVSRAGVVRTVAGKDLRTLWASPVPYVVGAVLQAVLGLLVVDQLAVRDQAVLQPLFPLAGFLVLLVVPVLTMRAFAEEARTGTLDQLLAVPVRPGSLVVAKWAAAWVSAVVVLAPATAFVGLTALWGDPDDGPAVAGFVGLALLAAAATAIGVLASACTESQPIAAVAALFAGVVAWFAHVGDPAVGDAGLLAALSFSERLRLFAGGAFDTGDVVFFVFATAAALVLAAAVIDLRRLR
jgi:ABC-2 type transport system permease protein